MFMYTTHEISIRLVEYKDVEPLYDLVLHNADRLRDSFPKTLDFFRSIEEAEKRVALLIENARDNRSYLFVVSLVGSEDIIGVLIIKEIDRRAMKAELAYYISKEYEGMGIITQGLKLLTQFAFSEAGLRKVYARVFPYNLSSKRVLLKNGFKLEGVLRKDFRNGFGELCDIEYYGLLK